MKKTLVIIVVFSGLGAILVMLSNILPKDAPVFVMEIRDIETKVPLQNVSVRISQKPPFPDKCKGSGGVPGLIGGYYSCPGRGDAYLTKKTDNTGRFELRKSELAEAVDEIAVNVQYSSDAGSASPHYDLFKQDADFLFALDRQSKKPLSTIALDGIGGAKVSSRKLSNIRKIDTSVPTPVIYMDIGREIPLTLEDDARTSETVIHIKSNESDAKDCLQSGITEVKDKMIYTHIQSNRCSTSHTIQRLLPGNDYRWSIDYSDSRDIYTIRVFQDYMAIIDERNLFTKIPDFLDRSGHHYIVTIQKDGAGTPYMEIMDQQELEFVCPLSTHVDAGYSDNMQVWIYQEKSPELNSMCTRKSQSANEYDYTWLALPSLDTMNYLSFHGHGLFEEYKIHRTSDGKVILTREAKSDQKRLGLKNNEKELEIKSSIPEVIIEEGGSIR